MNPVTIHSQPFPATGDARSARQQLEVLDEQGRRWQAKRQAIKRGLPFLR